MADISIDHPFLGRVVEHKIIEEGGYTGHIQYQPDLTAGPLPTEAASGPGPMAWLPTLSVVLATLSLAASFVGAP